MVFYYPFGEQAEIPLDPEKVQVIYTPSSGDAEEVPSISSFGACATTPNGGWYYDDPLHPSKITVCPCTCARLQAGRVDVRLGAGRGSDCAEPSAFGRVHRSAAGSLDLSGAAYLQCQQAVDDFLSYNSSGSSPHQG